MKRLNQRTTWMIVTVLAGSMAFMSGCGASEQSAADQAESSIEVLESTVEETQNMQTETEVETKTQTTEESETQSETETEKEAEVKTEAQSEEKTEAESKPQQQAQEVHEAVSAAEGSVSESDFAVVVKGVTIPLKGDMSVYAAQLGEPDAFGSAKSCTEAGDDKVYTYGGAVIYTYITNGVDVISLIEITGGESLPSGIHIGSTKADVIAAYGSSYTEEGTELLYEMGNRTIGLQMSGDTVSFIEIYG
ncbi:MAG: hypothetical protein K2N44_07120 [Lachnospiraceae bacterium]|nr:hypothetical protein [Lachnospiraceae bacterium]